MKMLFLIVALAAPLLFLPLCIYAGGQVGSARASGMGTAFIAVADDPAALYFNPAGITQLPGTNLYVGGFTLTPSATYKTPGGQEEDSNVETFFAPHLYTTSAINDRVWLGLGVFSPFGVGGTRWNEDGLTRYLSTRELIATIDANPTVTYRLSSAWSVGVGFDYLYSISESGRMVNQSAVNGSDAKLSLKSTGGGFGYNFGIFYRPEGKLKKWSIGAAYRSRVKVYYDGTMELSNIAPTLQPLFGAGGFSTTTNFTLTFPDTYSLGIAYRPSPRLTIALDAERVRWSTFKELRLDLEHEVPPALPNSITRLDWHDVWWLKGGAEYRLNDTLTLRAGYNYMENPVPDSSFEPGDPDANQHDLTVGAGFRHGGLTIDAFFMAVFGEERTVSNSMIAGEFRSRAYLSGLSFGYAF